MKAANFRLGFQSLDQESDAVTLKVTGAIPSWLLGTLIRNGPAKFEVGKRTLAHWFDGFSMLHAFTFKGGEVRYANRFLNTQAHEQAQHTGRVALREFATDPCWGLFGRAMSLFSPKLTDNANVNIARIADRFVALTETPAPVAFNPKTLETAGPFRYTDTLRGQLTTAHPHFDFAHEQLLNSLTRLARKSSYTLYRIADRESTRRTIATIQTDRPGYVHSFAVTERYIVLVEFPLVVNPLTLALSGKPFIENFRWRPERGTRFSVVSKRDGSLVGTYQAPACFAFHHVNAFERGENISIDVATYTDASIIGDLCLKNLRSTKPHALPTAQLTRFTLSLNGDAVDPKKLSEQPIELPRIHYRSYNGKPYRFCYGASTSDPADFLNQLVKINTETGGTTTWSEQSCYPGEPVFVAGPNAKAEDDGVILSIVLDAKNERSFMLILDAHSFSEVGRAEVPHHIPFGFHGQFFTEV